MVSNRTSFYFVIGQIIFHAIATTCDYICMYAWDVSYIYMHMHVQCMHILGNTCMHVHTNDATEAILLVLLIVTVISLLLTAS